MVHFTEKCSIQMKEKSILIFYAWFSGKYLHIFRPIKLIVLQWEKVEPPPEATLKILWGHGRGHHLIGLTLQECTYLLDMMTTID